jgi:hypothetical protein
VSVGDLPGDLDGVLRRKRAGDRTAMRARRQGVGFDSGGLEQMGRDRAMQESLLQILRRRKIC